MKKTVSTFLVIVLFTACMKEKESVDLVAEKTSFLTAGVWHFTGYTRNDGIGSVVLTYSSLPACRQDDQRNFNNNGTGEVNEGATKCNSSDPQSSAVQWNFVNGAPTLININGTEYTIHRLDNNTFDFSVRRTDPYASEINYVYTR